MTSDYKEDLRVVRSRNLLCKAFFELLEVMPYEKITVIDICNKAMVHRATFYNHFEDKEHLLAYAIDQIQEDMFNATIEKEKYATPKEMYMSLISKAIDFVEENRQQFLLIINNNSKHKIMELLLDTINRSIRYLTSKNQYKEDFKIPYSVIIDFLAGGITNLGLCWLQSDKPCSKSDLLHYFDILLDEQTYIKNII